MIIGVDVGGTNTDAVLMDGDGVIAAIKTPTTADVMSGISNALAGLIERAGPQTRAARTVVIGTTHFVNAVVERQRLNRVAAVRLCLPASSSIPPFIDWPADLRELVRSDVHLLPGGYEVDGREIAPFDADAMAETARRIADSGVTAVAVSGVFSALRNDQERAAAEILDRLCPGVRVCLSSDLGRTGLLERENVALLNASLFDLARTTIAAFREAIAHSGLAAELFLTQNDGTVMSADLAERAPVLCFSSGPTNSMRGAAFLSGRSDGIVIDVGGTTSDIGMLVNGFPREANGVVEIGGVRTLFRMPDVLCLGLGGGTRIRTDPFRMGPDSVGYRLTEDARVFGGEVLTADRVADLSGALLGDFDAAVRSLLEDGIESMKTRAGDLPVIAVGGGAFLIPQDLAGVSEVVFVEHHDVANAVGAAMAQICGEVDRVYTDMTREAALGLATEEARDRAVAAGASVDTLTIVDVEDLPLAYMPGGARRMRVRVAGELAAA
jgi:N-methylhydantoinase A/oxoprolinase/acetone carboxylase beta subunit